MATSLTVTTLVAGRRLDNPGHCGLDSFGFAAAPSSLGLDVRHCFNFDDLGFGIHCMAGRRLVAG